MAKTQSMGEVQVPTCFTGYVTALDGPDFCMDGATHAIEHGGMRIRLRAGNAAVTKALKAAENSGTMWVACGYKSRGPECDHLSVYSLEKSAEFEKRLRAAKLLPGAAELAKSMGDPVPVSDDLARVLEQLTQEDEAGSTSRPGGTEIEKAAAKRKYGPCRWLGRCYYCFFAGRWWLIGCI